MNSGRLTACFEFLICEGYFWPVNSYVPNFAFNITFVCFASPDPEDIGPSLLVHTSVPFGIQHLEMDMNDVKDIIITHLNATLPNLPVPMNSRCIRWRYSQVSRGVEGTPGCAVLCDIPLLIACGDAFSHSNFDGCIESALSVADAFSKTTLDSNL